MEFPEYGIQACGTKGTVRHTPTHVKRAMLGAPKSNATSNTANAASAARTETVSTNAAHTGQRVAWKSSTGRPGP